MRAPRSCIWDLFAGWTAAQLFLAALIFFDVNGIAGLLRQAGDPIIPLLLLSLCLGGLVAIAALATGLARSGDQRTLPKNVLMSSTRRSGASIAAKCPPRGISVQ